MLAELTEPEQELMLAAATGELVDLQTGDAHLDHPGQSVGWDARCSVRAELLIELLTGRRQPENGPSAGG